MCILFLLVKPQDLFFKKVDTKEIHLNNSFRVHKDYMDA